MKNDEYFSDCISEMENKLKESLNRIGFNEKYSLKNSVKFSLNFLSISRLIFNIAMSTLSLYLLFYGAANAMDYSTDDIFIILPPTYYVVMLVIGLWALISCIFLGINLSEIDILNDIDSKKYEDILKVSKFDTKVRQFSKNHILKNHKITNLEYKYMNIKRKKYLVNYYLKDLEKKKESIQELLK